MQYRKKPDTVEAITFDELVEHGKASGAGLVNGMPWSFTYKGRAVTHENDDCYLIAGAEFQNHHRFERGQMLISTPSSSAVFEQEFFLSVLPAVAFYAHYEPVTELKPELVFKISQVFADVDPDRIATMVERLLLEDKGKVP